MAGASAPLVPQPDLAPISIIGAEDEDFDMELKRNAEEHNSQFQNLEQVKQRPAHLMALLQHVALQFEPGPLLCCLHADMLGSLGPKEAKKAFLDFRHSFLDKTAVLRVQFPPHVAFELDRLRPDLSEAVQWHLVQEVVQSQQAAVSRQLKDFCSKRLMGMTPWEQELDQLETWAGRDGVSYTAWERHVAEQLLAHLEEMQHTISTDQERNAAVVGAIRLYMHHLGVRTKSRDKKSGRNFFRKKVMGNQRSREPPKTNKGLSSILDTARWNQDENHSPDLRHPKGNVDRKKPGPKDRKGGLGVSSQDCSAQTSSQDTLRVSLHPICGVDGEPGIDTTLEIEDPPQQGPASQEPLDSTEKNADTKSPEPGEDGKPERSGLELEPEEPPGWLELKPQDTLHSLPKSQMKQQEVISGECRRRRGRKPAVCWFTLHCGCYSPRLSEATARSPELHPGGRNPRTWAILSCFPK